jgi:putative transcriptional regulator
MLSERFLTGQLLIAMPALADPNFSHAVALICEHTERGALGIVINRPLTMRMGEVFEQMALEPSRPALRDLPVLRGGPVQSDRGFVIHAQNDRGWDSSIEVTDDLTVTTSRDILQAIAAGDGPAQLIMALGYAGWDAGQLETEMRQNAWLNAPCDPSIVFEVPFEARWQAAARVLGVDMARLSHFSGRA